MTDRRNDDIFGLTTDTADDLLDGLAEDSSSADWYHGERPDHRRTPESDDALVKRLTPPPTMGRALKPPTRIGIAVTGQRHLAPVAPSKARPVLRQPDGRPIWPVEQENSPTYARTVLLAPIDDSDTDGRGFVKRYGCLTGAVPLAPVPDRIDTISAVLDAEFPWLSRATARVMRDLRVRLRAGEGAFRFAPILLSGPPGVGKTAWARRMASLMAVPVIEMLSAGSADARWLTGTARGWAGARPSGLIVGIREHMIGNPVVIADDLDRASASRHNGSVLDALLRLLEPSSAASVHDEALCVPADLSCISWVMNANNHEALPAALLSRLHVVRVEAPAPEHAAAIIRTALARIAATLGLPVESLPVDPDGFESTVADMLEGGRSLRAVHRMIEGVCLDMLDRRGMRTQ